MNRRGFFGRLVVALGATFTVKLKAGPGDMGLSPNTAKITPQKPDWQVLHPGIFIGDRHTDSGVISYSYADKNSKRIVHVMRDGRKCIV